MHERAKVSAVRYALKNLNQNDRIKLVNSVLAGVQSDADGDIVYCLEELQLIKSVGEATAREILFALGLLLIEADISKK